MRLLSCDPTWMTLSSSTKIGTLRAPLFSDVIRALASGHRFGAFEFADLGHCEPNVEEDSNPR
jgi:hypothetical protein